MCKGLGEEASRSHCPSPSSDFLLRLRRAEDDLAQAKQVNPKGR